MGSAEDQSEFTVSREIPPGRDNAPDSLQSARNGDRPQNPHPQRPKETGDGDGPAFEFESPEVVAAESELRKAAAELQESLKPPSEAGGWEGGEPYRRLAGLLEDRLPILYARYDAYVSAVLATGNTKVTCSRGCGHCCSHYVTSVEPFELAFLHGRIRKSAAYASKLVAFHRRAALFNRLLAEEKEDEAEDRSLFRYYLRDVPCPFLSSSGECGVYESRPMSCRMFFSQSHPSLCRGKAAASPGNRNFILELPADIEASLARAGMLLSALQLPESLFEGLLKANEIFGRYDQEEE